MNGNHGHLLCTHCVLDIVLNISHKSSPLIFPPKLMRWASLFFFILHGRKLSSIRGRKLHQVSPLLWADLGFDQEVQCQILFPFLSSLSQLDSVVELCTWYPPSVFRRHSASACSPPPRVLCFLPCISPLDLNPCYPAWLAPSFIVPPFCIFFIESHISTAMSVSIWTRVSFRLR